MRRIVIIGNSGAARECYGIVRDVFAADVSYAASHRFAGFLSWKKYPGDLKDLSSLALGDADAYTPQPEDLFIMGVADPLLRAAIFDAFKARGAAFMNLVHPLADVCRSASLGEGNILQRGSFILCDAVVGNGNYLNGFVGIAHDAVLGDCNFLAPQTMILGSAVMGSRNRFGPSAILLDRARVGDDNLISPGSIVYKGCGSHCRMAGNPALKIGDMPMAEEKAPTL